MRKITGLILSALVGSAVFAPPCGAQGQHYFERAVPVHLDMGGGHVDASLPVPAGLYADVRMISAFCQFPYPAKPTGALIQIGAPPGSGIAQGTLMVPMALQIADDKAASPFRYFAGTIATFLQRTSGQQVTVNAQATAGSTGDCTVSFYGLVVQPPP